MRIGSLFSGIGGLEKGLEMSGLGHTVWQVEQDAFCQAVLVKHWPYVERFEDVKEVGRRNLSPVDVLCGGFPCQNVSSAGKGEGLSGSRSGLWFEFARIIGELQPPWVVIENVASGAKRWVDQVTSHLGELGYETLPIPISASDVGAPHQRRRIFLVAYSHQAGLEEWEGVQQTRTEMEPSSSERMGRGGDATNPDSESEPVVSEYEQVGWMQDFTEDGGWQWRAPCSPVCGSDDDVPNRVDRLKSLGNSVVPQCAEVVGHVIQQLIAAQHE